MTTWRGASPRTPAPEHVDPAELVPTSFSRRAALRGLAGLGAVAGLSVLGAGSAGAAPARVGPSQATPGEAVRPFGLANPLIEKRADPWVWRHTDGRYLFTASVPEYDRIVLRAADSLAGLSTAQERTLWTRPATGQMGGHIWAPEIHPIGDRWYIHFAAGDSDNFFRIRMYVLESDGPDPMTANWSVRGQILTRLNTFSLDATTFTVGRDRYLVWAQLDPAVSQHNTDLRISKMSGPSTLTGPEVVITRPTLTWEKAGLPVNEGPATLIRDGRILLTYSAAVTDSRYCIGLLTASARANLLSAASWRKSQTPVFTTWEPTGKYGPGHSCFTTVDDGVGGVADVLVHHARDYRDITGDSLYDPNRHARAQRIYWNNDGSPSFGVPVANGALPLELVPVSTVSSRVRHRGGRGRVDPNQGLGADSWFRVVPGLSGTGVSLESANYPGRYLRATRNGVTLVADDSTAPFARAVSWVPRAGLSGAGESFESVLFPGSYLRHRDSLLWAEPVGSDTDRASATYTLR